MQEEDCLEPYGHAAHEWTTGWGPRKGEPRWCSGSAPVPNGAHTMNHPAADRLQGEARQMLHRLSDREATLNEPVYAAQLKFAEQTVRILVESLLSSGVDERTTHEVVEKFVLGMLPSAAQAKALRDSQRRLTDVLSRTSLGDIQ